MYRPHIIQFPSKKWGFVGSIPLEIEGKVFDTRDDAIKEMQHHSFWCMVCCE